MVVDRNEERHAIDDTLTKRRFKSASVLGWSQISPPALSIACDGIADCAVGILRNIDGLSQILEFYVAELKISACIFEREAG